MLLHALGVTAQLLLAYRQGTFRCDVVCWRRHDGMVVKARKKHIGLLSAALVYRREVIREPFGGRHVQFTFVFCFVFLLDLMCLDNTL